MIFPKLSEVTYSLLDQREGASYTVPFCSFFLQKKTPPCPIPPPPHFLCWQIWSIPRQSGYEHWVPTDRIRPNNPWRYRPICSSSVETFYSPNENPVPVAIFHIRYMWGTYLEKIYIFFNGNLRRDIKKYVGMVPGITYLDRIRIRNESENSGPGSGRKVRILPQVFTYPPSFYYLFLLHPPPPPTHTQTRRSSICLPRSKFSYKWDCATKLGEMARTLRIRIRDPADKVQ